MGPVLPRGVRANPGKLVSVRKTHTFVVRRAGVSDYREQFSFSRTLGWAGRQGDAGGRAHIFKAGEMLHYQSHRVSALPTMMPGIGLAPGHS